MTVNLPIEIEQFAQNYFAAEARAKDYNNSGKTFRQVDRKDLARDCKLLLESGVVENLAQLSMDLCRYRPGFHHATHMSRLRNFAQQAGITYRKPKGTSGLTVVQVAKVATPQAFDFKSEIGASFTRALRKGMPLSTVLDQAKEVLVNCNHTLQVDNATTSLQQLIRTTGLSADQLAKIATSL